MLVQVLSVIAAGISIVNAECTYPPPLANNLPGNSLTRPDGLHTPIKGQEFEIVWDATGLSNSVQLVLLRGPGENIQFNGYVTKDAPNTGSYKWTPSCDLETDVTHYGLMIIDNADCKFQWSTQFGMAAGPSCGAVSSSAPPTPSPSTTKTLPSSSPKPSGKPEYSDKPTHSDKPDHSDKPEHSATQPPHPEASEDCSTEEPPKSYPSGGSPWGPPGAVAGPWGPASNATLTSAYWAGSTGSVKPSTTYSPEQANDGARFGMSMFGAAAALAAAVFVL